MKKIVLVLILLPFLSKAQQGDEAMIKKISDEILRNGNAYELLSQLTKQVGGRLAGSPQFAKAIQWGKSTLEQQGAEKVWLQECMVPHWVRGGQDKAMIVEVDKKRRGVGSKSAVGKTVNCPKVVPTDSAVAKSMALNIEGPWAVV